MICNYRFFNAITIFYLILAAYLLNAEALSATICSQEDNVSLSVRIEKFRSLAKKNPELINNFTTPLKIVRNWPNWDWDNWSKAWNNWDNWDNWNNWDNWYNK